MLTERQKLLIEKNILGNITPEESQELKEYQKDPEFQEEFSFQEDLRQAVRLEQRDALDEVLLELKAQVEKDLLTEGSSEKIDETGGSSTGSPQAKVHSLRPTWVLAVAASLILAVSLVFFLLIDTSPGVTIEHLALANLPEDTELPDDTPRTKDGLDINTKLALEAYEQKNYSEAESLFNEVPEGDKNNKALLYNAVTLLMLNQQNVNDEYLSRGIEYLERIAQGNSGYRPYAEWYLAIAYLTNGDETSAVELLTNISNKEQHPYNKQAAKMLNELE
ncbi:tetratricopeptide repeat protein [Tunicatimonas pelagia]|uniref:tetratricopeptide repeat protein n=1 Tax=Tunicatimonas pelagia TaxID=931531 RepID=UPI002665134D|nr:hypothetical protein [Tunicatimonas pelagia]WKN45256.1 hypothetical protein P0M28_09830 [Tunicatimonas pelagia]